MASVGDFELLTGSSSPLLAAGDVVRFVDVSDSTQAAQGSLVRATMTQFFAAIPVPIIVAAGTVTTSQPVFSATETWNAGGVTFTGIKLNVTSTASAAASYLIDLQIAGTSKFNVQKDGAIRGAGLIHTLGAVATQFSTWANTFTTLELGPTTGFIGGASSAWLQNSVWDGVNNKYMSSAGASAITLGANSFMIQCAAAGVVGNNITFTTVINGLATGLTISVPTAQNAGTITDTTPAFAGTVTWNSGGTTFVGWKLNVTSTASAAASLLMDLQLGTVSQWNVTKAGLVTQTGALVIGGSLTYTTNLISTTALATPGALSATQSTEFASTVSGATLMGFGTSSDVTLKNRSGTDVLTVVANTTTVKCATAISVGAATPSTSGAGVSFPAAQSASTDVNTLDDYEEGTWTPSLGGSATYTAQTGTYIKIGKLVWINGIITVNAIGTGSTTTISGLPFTSTNTVAGHQGSAGYFAGLAINVLHIMAYVPGNTTTVGFNSLAAAGATATNLPAIFGNAATIYFTVCYEATA